MSEKCIVIHKWNLAQYRYYIVMLHGPSDLSKYLQMKINSVCDLAAWCIQFQYSDMIDEQ